MILIYRTKGRLEKLKQFLQDLRVNNKKDPLVLCTLLVFRFGNWVYYKAKIPFVRQILLILYQLLDLLFVRIIGNSLIPAKCNIGGGLRLPHGGNGIVIHPNVTIGTYATIFHQVTIGNRDTPSGTEGPPELGNYVYIGAGAKILGQLKIGDRVAIGANAVVINDVPSDAIAVGVPARVINSGIR